MPRSSGQVVISIDWNPRSNKHLEISQVLQHQQIAATWIAGTPQIAIPQGITKSDEVAVVVPAREEEDLPQVLRQQINTIEGQHGRVATASLQGHLIPRGLLTDLGISIVRRDESALAPTKGLFCAPRGLHLPAHGWWGQRGLDFAINRALRKVVDGGRILHLQVATEDFRSASEIKGLARIQETIRPLRDQDKLEIGPLKCLGTRLRRAEGQPQRAVLRAA